MTTLEVSVFDYVLTNVLSLLAGVFLGLGVCSCYRDKLLGRTRSREYITPPSVIANEVIKETICVSVEK